VFGIMKGKRGAAALELALVLPMLLVLSFGAIDFGRLIYARLIIASVSREGGSLACRFISPDDAATEGVDEKVVQINNLSGMLQQSGLPLDLSGSGKIWISQITAGVSNDDSEPNLYGDSPYGYGSLGGSGASSSTVPTEFGLIDALRERLVFHEGKGPDLDSVWVVEVYYKYVPITPLPNLITGILNTPGYDGIILGSKAIFSGGT
jgi:hypothetical protein